MPNGTKVMAIVQARMGSTRLPGKVMKDIEGRPMLWHVINRLRLCQKIDNVIIATTNEDRDDSIEEFCKNVGVDCFRGSENDVLDRYYKASKKFEADAVVRVTSDCPLIDPEVSGKVISAFLAKKDELDGASNMIKRTFPRGLDTEIVSIDALERIWKQAIKSYEREHVTIYMRENPNEFVLESIENVEDFSTYRWTVDELRDLSFVRAIYRKLFKNNEIFLMHDVLDLVHKYPTIVSINKEVLQKAVKLEANEWKH